MKRVLVPALFAFLVLAVLVLPALAQAPAPKVTITGLFDQITSAGRNFYDGNMSRDNDREWYARTRFRPDFTFEVGRVKAVLGLEIDLSWGQSGPNDGGFPGNTTGSAGGVAVVGAGNATTGCVTVWTWSAFKFLGNDLIVFHVLDPQELDFDFDDASSFEDLESRDQVPVVPQSFRQQYRELIREHINALTTRFSEQRIDYAVVNTSEPLDRALFSYLSSREKLMRVR